MVAGHGGGGPPPPPRRKPKKKKKVIPHPIDKGPKKPIPHAIDPNNPTFGGTTTTTTTTANEDTGLADVTGTGAPMATSASTTAPYQYQDTAADQADQNLEAFFSSAATASPALHYHLDTIAGNQEQGAQA